MSKTDPNFPAGSELLNGPVPSFDAIRTDEDDRSELRRNQTVPMPIGLRAELAAHELPSLPAEHLRSTDDMDEALKSMRSDPEAVVARPRHDGKWILILLLVASIAGGGVGYFKWRSAVGEVPASATQTVAPATPIKPQAAVPLVDVTSPTPTTSIVVPTVGSRTAPNASVKAISNDHKEPARQHPKVTGMESEPDPNDLIFKPQ